MKQHITIDQWNEVKLLSPKIPHDMNIGQMLEFLDGKFINFWRGARKDWLIVIDDEKHIVKDELVDCLWQAVKHELSEVGGVTSRAGK